MTVRGKHWRGLPVDGFPIGCAVTMTREARQEFRLRSGPTGRVIGYGRKRDMIRVIRDGQVTVDTWWAGWWERDEDTETERMVAQNGYGL